MPTVVTNSACSDKQAHLAHRLHEAVPQGAKLALCFDPEGDLDGCETIVDTAGRAWRMLTYQEDDLAFRLAIREREAAGWHADAPVLLRLASGASSCSRSAPPGEVTGPGISRPGTVPCLPCRADRAFSDAGRYTQAG